MQHVYCVCITTLTETPALNWTCAVFASRRYNAIICHGRDWRLRQLSCGGRGSGRGRHTHTAQHLVQPQVSAVACGCVSIAQLITVTSIQKFWIVASVSNRIEEQDTIRLDSKFQIFAQYQLYLNTRTSLHGKVCTPHQSPHMRFALKSHPTQGANIKNEYLYGHSGWPLPRHCDIPDSHGTPAYVKCRSYYGTMRVL